MGNVVEIVLEVNKTGDGFKVVQQGLSGINKEAGRASSGGKKFGQSMMQATGKAYAGLQRVERSLMSLPALIAAAGIGLLANSFLDAASTAEKYRTRLEVLLGSQAEGNRLFKEMAEYAGQVPFEYEQVMGAATALAGVMKGGVDEIRQWMPMIGDLAAASGMTIEETTGQVIRMYSAGAASADMFRERGILSMLGFQAGVSYSAEETRQQLMDAWNDPQSKFHGATEKMADDWDGMTSMMKDAWFMFRTEVMDTQVFSALKTGLGTVLDKINELKEKGDIADWAEKFASIALKSFEVVGQGVAWLARAFMGWKMIWNGLQIAFDGMIVAITGSMSWFLNKFAKLYDFLKIDDVAADLRGMADGLDDYAARAAERIQGNLDDLNAAIEGNDGIIRAQNALTAFFDQIKKDSKETTSQVVADTKKIIATTTAAARIPVKLAPDVGGYAGEFAGLAPQTAGLPGMGQNEDAWGYMSKGLAKETEKMSGIWADFNQDLHASFEYGFADLFKEGIHGIGDAFNQFTDMMVESFARAMAQMATDAMFSSFGSAGGFGGILSGVGSWIAGLFHDGGVVGATSPAGYMAVSPAMFAHAPRLHSGLAPDEFPAILQRGETVIPKGGGSAGGVVEVNVYNNGSNTQATVKERKTGNGLSVDVMIEQLESGLSTRIAQGRGSLQKTLTRTYGLNRAAGGFR